MADGRPRIRPVRAVDPAQYAFKFHPELIVDLFAGGGGASIGIEQAFGRPVDVAVNHDQLAVSVHQALHPHTRHYCEDVYAVDPLEATQGRAVGLLHASPDCTHFSQAKGGQPRSRTIRALSWVVLKWAGKVRPRVITLENVDKILQWSPLRAKRCSRTGRVVRLDGSVAARGERVPISQQFLIPCHKRRGQNWRHFVGQLRGLGYQVQWRKLRACDYGAGTTRERLFMVARCDGLPIRWPAPTHAPRDHADVRAPRDHADVRAGRRLPYVSAADCIDWSIPACSIFATQDEANTWAGAHGMHRPQRPLRDASLQRIARGVQRFVIHAKEPFLVEIANRGRAGGADAATGPLRTITAQPKGGAFAVANATLVPLTHQGERQPHDTAEPAPTITAANRGELGLAGAVLVNLAHGEGRPGGVQRWGSGAQSVDCPAATITAGGGSQAVVAAHIVRQFGTSVGHEAGAPLGTVMTQGGGKSALVSAWLVQHNLGCTGHPAKTPLSTITQTGTQQQLAECVVSPEPGLSPEMEAAALRCAAFLIRYHGTGGQWSHIDNPATAITTRDRLALVTVWIAGDPWVIVDITMRMLQPPELARCQGFPPEYPLDRRHDGRSVSKTDQVRLIGNSVSPPVLRALVEANCGELIAVEQQGVQAA